MFKLKLTNTLNDAVHVKEKEYIQVGVSYRICIHHRVRFAPCEAIPHFNGMIVQKIRGTGERSGGTAHGKVSIAQGSGWQPQARRNLKRLCVHNKPGVHMGK